jgi:hypothetical protein
MVAVTGSLYARAGMKRFTYLGVFAANAVAVSLALIACRPKPGDACRTGDGECTSGPDALVCVDRAIVAMTCKGPAGCSKGPLRCDWSGNAEGDACYEAPAGAQRCAPDGRARVSCVKGRVHRETCEGPQHCKATGEERASCDKLLAVGAECTVKVVLGEALDDVCASDGSAWLQCRDGKLAVVTPCRGKGGCRAQQGMVTCDGSVGIVGDPCIGRARTCSTDGAKVLACKDGRLVDERACSAGAKCETVQGEPRCPGG